MNPLLDEFRAMSIELHRSHALDINVADLPEHWRRCGFTFCKTRLQLIHQVEITPVDDLSVQPEWCRRLPLQQQSVLMLAARGPDGIGKLHPCKRIQRAYRACVLKAAYEGGEMRWGQGRQHNSFMGLDEFADGILWAELIDRFFESIDELPHHFIMHLIHGAEILGYKHPLDGFRARWQYFYGAAVGNLHLMWETEKQMDARLCDWNREHWGK